MLERSPAVNRFHFAACGACRRRKRCEMRQNVMRFAVREGAVQQVCAPLQADSLRFAIKLASNSGPYLYMGFTARHFFIFVASGLAGLLVADAWAQSSSAYELSAGPLRVRNVSPVVQLYGMPRMVGARVIDGYTESTLNFEAANNFQSDNRLGTFVFLDGETYITSYRMRGGWGNGLEWGVEVPYVAHTGGGLDGVVDEFHEVFGLPDGERSLAPRGRLDYLIRSDGVDYADFNDSVRSLGDVRGFLGYQWIDRDGHALAVRSQIKLPTGKVKDLSGSEGLDVSLWGEYEYGFASKILNFSITVAGGVSYLGEGELIPEEQVTWMGFGHIGIQIPLHDRVALHAQLDAHTDILDTGNPLAADGGVLGTIGGRIGLTRRLWVDLAIIEDLENESASDVVFQILLGAKF